MKQAGRITGTRMTGNRFAPLSGLARTPRRRSDLRGNRLYTLLPGRTGRASGHSLYSRRVRHP
ncbi:hypothetical protein DF048_12010 [Burkholderia seminalis]|nr:hypothetical protein DF032_27175 [Burkholderia seminalis]RQS95249.1 hypothetical protein DF048_12010 [Burkholderia seminalis]